MRRGLRRNISCLCCALFRTYAHICVSNCACSCCTSACSCFYPTALFNTTTHTGVFIVICLRRVCLCRLCLCCICLRGLCLCSLCAYFLCLSLTGIGQLPECAVRIHVEYDGSAGYVRCYPQCCRPAYKHQDIPEEKAQIHEPEALKLSALHKPVRGAECTAYTGLALVSNDNLGKHERHGYIP